MSPGGGQTSTFPSDPYVLTGATVVIGVLVVSALARLFSSKEVTYTDAYIHRVQQIVQQGTDASHLAMQDTDPVLALQHTTQCLVYLDVALRLADARTLEKHVDIDIHAFVDRARKKQAQAQKLVVRSSEKMGPLQ